MKKIIAYLIISLFLLSAISTTLAEERTTKISEAKAERTEQKIELQKTKAEEIRANQKERLNTAIEKCKENNLDPELCQKKLQKRVQLVDKLKEKDLTRLQRIQERKTQKLEELEDIEKNPKLLKYKKSLDFKARKIAQAELTNAKQKYVKAKERYQTTRKNYLAAKNGFKEAKTRFKECEDEETAECNQWGEEIKERAKEFLLTTADNILEHLNKIKTNVESNEDLTEEESAEILVKIDEMVQEIEDARSTIESSENKEEIMEASRKIKQGWLRIRKRLVIHTGRVINARIGGIIVKIKYLEAKIERILSRMEEKGIDTSEIQSLVNEFNTKVNEAKDNYEQALDKFKEATSAEDVEKAHELAVEGHKLMKAAHKSLQEAQKLLRDIVRSIKQAGGEEELTATEDEAEEEAEEETKEDEGESSTLVEGGELE